MTRRKGSTTVWWSPRSQLWRIGVLFMVGSACFAVAAVPKFVECVGVRANNVTYFVGSLFFTAAAAMQWRMTMDGGAPTTVDRGAVRVQFVGTLFFNLTTLMALSRALTTTAEIDRHVWVPDAFGSICFLIASALAWFAVGDRWVFWRRRDSSWWIAALNFAGSIAFGIAAVASYVVPATGNDRNVTAVGLGTFIGALAFLVGALLLLPAKVSEVRSQAAFHLS